MNRISGSISLAGRELASSSARRMRLARMSSEKALSVSPRLVPMSSA